MSKPHYITTPIYYPNAEPHLGSSYTTTVADVLHRFKRLFGNESFFLTGTDEHGQKVADAAKARGLEPQQHVDELSRQFENVWKRLGIEPDIFMRTTYPFHIKGVQAALQKLWEKELIYKSEYEGWYSVSEEIFYTDKDLVDGKSPEGKPVTKVTETNYFFKMSQYQEKLIDYIHSHPDFILPVGKKAEVLGFLKQPLTDLCISRPKSRFTWGIELPFDKDYVCYVWFDALLNYVTALGYEVAGDDGSRMKKFWPAVTHIIGKDILTTHTVYWTTMLMALELPLPNHVFAHGWWLNTSGKKMSKSEGETQNPLELLEILGVDSLRYALVRMMRFGQDASFSLHSAKELLNEELANTYGNLVSRATNLIAQNFEGQAPEMTQNESGTKEIIEAGKALPAKIEARINAFEPDLAIQDIYAYLAEVNRYITSAAPWKTLKEGETGRKKAGETLAVVLEALRISSILLQPVMPEKTKEVLAALGNPGNSLVWGQAEKPSPIGKAPPLFPKFVSEEKKLGNQ